jgi:REP element-mobilizing transposase RayT
MNNRGSSHAGALPKPITEEALTPPVTGIIESVRDTIIFMPRVRRANLPHGTFFCTCTTHKRKSWFGEKQNAQIIVDQWIHYETEYQFRLHTYCVMPNHYHAVLTEGSIKTLSQILHAVNSYIVTSLSKQHTRSQKPKVFQGNPWVEAITEDDMYWQKVSYTLFNPWRDGKVKSPMDGYKFSDIERWIEDEGVEFMEDLFSKYKRWYE